MEKRWIKAATIQTPTLKVGGRRLLPFCLRHRVLLEAVDSPVIGGNRTITPQDLLFAVRVLATHDPEAVRKPATLRESFLLAYYTHFPVKFYAEVIKLNTYFNAQSLWCRFWEKDTSKDPGGIPWQLAIIAGLVRNGCTLNEAWTMPEAEAVWLHVAHCRAAGAKIDVVSEQEWEAMERYKAEEAAKAKTTKNFNRN